MTFYANCNNASTIMYNQLCIKEAIQSNSNKSSSKLIVFDADGVLLDNEMGGFKEILVLLGKEKEVRELDEEYKKRKYSGPWGLEELAWLYVGYTFEELNKRSLDYCKSHAMEGAKEVIYNIKKKGYLAGSISSNPQFIMDGLTLLFCLDFSEGNHLEFHNGIATGKINRRVDRYVKADILKQIMQQKNVQKENTVVVGDSITDLLMAECAGLFIAFNSKPEVKERADVIIKKKDFREILSYLV